MKFHEGALVKPMHTMECEWVFCEAEYAAKRSTTYPNSSVFLSTGDQVVMLGEPKVYVIVYFYLRQDSKKSQGGWQ